jgi:class 3 adenylate cyclase/tetratricopeptide (TPR) repeat protein
VAGFGGEPSPEVRKKVTAVFADMAGSTTLAETLDPELYRQVVQAFFERMARTIERHGGSVENFVGDEVMGIFGAPVAHGDDALRAVRAADRMLREVRDLSDEIEPRVGTPLGLRIGVNTGTVVVGAPIAGRSMSLGDTMNVAARLEKLAEPGQILIGEDTYRLVRGEVDVEPAGKVELRGRAEPLATYALLSASRSEGEPLADRPMLGRERDLALLQVAFERCVARDSCEFVTVLGEPGVGKSRLVAEMLQRYHGSATVLVGRCLPYGEGITYWPLTEIAWQAAGIEDSDDADVALGKLDAVLAADPDGPTIARHLAQITGLDDSFDPGEQAFWAVRRLLEALAARRPVIVWIEDLQWAEPTMLELVLHLSRQLRSLPIMLACTARFELLDKRPDWRQSSPTTISLDALPDDAINELVDALTGGGIGADLRDRIVGLAAGNPLFVEQLLSMLIDEGALRRSADGWVARNGATPLDVPPTIEAVLAARIDHLSQSERALAEAASVIGKDFWADAAAALAGEGGLEEVESLVRKRLIEPVRRPGVPRDFFQFRHILVRDAVYGALSKARRADLHEGFADWLLGWSGSRIGQIEEIVGYHLETAHDCRQGLLGSAQHVEQLAYRAASHLANAGRRAAARQDDAAAAALLARAVALLAESGGSDPAARLEPLVELGTALVRGGETERADQVLAEARRAVVAAGDERAEARMRVLEANLKRLTDPVWWTNHGRTAAEQALAVFHRLGEDLDAARAWHLLGKVHSDRGQQAAAAEALERALELAAGAGDAGVEAWIRYWLLQVQTLGPTPCERVVARAREDLEWARAHDNRALEGSTLGRMGEMLARSGRVEEAQLAFARARDVFVELDLPVHVAYLALSTALVEPLASDPVAAEAELRPAIELFDETGATHISASLLPVLSLALTAQGRLEEALAASERTEEIAAADDLDAQVKWRIARARALAASGVLADAERFAREAIEVASRGDGTVLSADAHGCLGDVLLAARSPSEAVPALERAVELYAGKGDVVSAARRRAMLESLSGTKFL